MAIKGKSKGRTARAVTRGPKPAYVEVKRPILARRGFWVGVAVVAGVLLVAALWYGFAKQASEDRERDRTERMAAAVTDYREQLDPILVVVGQPVAPVGFTAFPDLEAAIAELEADSEDAPADPDAIAATADEARDAATSAVEALEALDEGALVQGQDLPAELVLNIINSKGNFQRSMQLYVQVAELTKAAARAQGAEREALVARARGVADVAAELAGRANSEFVDAQVTAGVFDPAAVPAVPSLPTGPTG
jgi:hypothetical protein